MKKVFNKRYDLTGNEISRLLRIAAFGKIIPIGNLRGGPGLRCLTVLTILHFLGHPIYLVNVKYGQRLGPFKRILRRLRRS